MKKIGKNEERTALCLQNFNREKTLKLLISNDAPVILDIGANSGQSLLKFKQWWPEAEIHCFEPQEECWDDLMTCRMRYDQESIFINKCAVGDQPVEEKLFYAHDIHSGLSGFNKINLLSKDSIDLAESRKNKNNSPVPYGEGLNKERTVRVIRLDDYARKSNLNKADLVKIDTQTHEVEVLLGMGEFLSKSKVVTCELKLYDYYEKTLSFTDIEKPLHEAGFSLYDIPHIAKNPMNGRTDWLDVIYVNNELR
jgi:FkbM family methyltransferase